MPARLATYLRFTRPFTLLPPLLGMASGAVTAVGAIAHRQGIAFTDAWTRLGGTSLWLQVAMGAGVAVSLNAGSNILNQWTDLDGDRINKPHRPLVTGAVSRRESALLIALFYGLAIGLAWGIHRGERYDTLLTVLGGAVLTLVYSVPPLRTKRFGMAAGLTIATARGCLLKVAGWSCVAAVFSDPEPWFIGAVLALFLIGASATKDFADIEGDRRSGCATWPVRYGPERAARMIAPFLMWPWLLIPLGCWLPRSPSDATTLLTGNPTVLTLLAIVLFASGIGIRRMILRDPAALADAGENHPSWAAVYRQMLMAQVGLMVAYAI